MLSLGYKGKHCGIEINECQDNPCGENGHCIDQVDKYECYCNRGYYGKNCQIPSSKSCPTDEENYYEIESHCYYFETHSHWFKEAKSNCEKENLFSTGSGKLFEPKTLAENDMVTKMIPDNDKFLIGVMVKGYERYSYCENNYEYVYAKNGANVVFRNRTNNPLEEPDWGKVDCVSANSSGTWFAASSNYDRLPSICEEFTEHAIIHESDFK